MLNFFANPQVNMKPLYDLLDDDINFYWNGELETLFQQFKTSFKKNFTPTLTKKTSNPQFYNLFNNWYCLCPIPREY